VINDPTDQKSRAVNEKMMKLVDAMMRLQKQQATAVFVSQKKLLQSQIDSTDAEIDQLVYELYGLTADEITLIEDSYRNAKPPANGPS
jgi:hypothetical protein